MTDMRTHIDVLGWLHAGWGALGVLTGLALLLLALGTQAAISDATRAEPAVTAAVWMFLVCGGLLVTGGVLMAAAGQALRRRRALGRLAVLGLAVPNLVVVPFGTALGVYACWALLNDDARAEFGRPPRALLGGVRA
jgi:nucleoside recognition membrane protein YjiH